MGAQNVLIVEDEIVLRMFIADGLRDEGYEVFEAGNADEALTILGAGIKIDLLLTDVRMPGTMDGIGLALHSKREAPLRPVIISSGHIAPDDANRADAFLRKPYSTTDLLGHVEALIGPPCQTTIVLPKAS